MSEYAPLRDAFHELNRLLIDKQQWDAQHEVAREEMGLKRQMAEQQMQDQLLKRKTLQKDAMEAEAAMKPREANVFEFLPKTPETLDMLNNNSDLRYNIARSWGGEGVDLTTGRVVDNQGQTVSGPGFEIGNRAAAAHALFMAALTPDVVANSNLRAIDGALADRQAQLDGIPDLPINAAQRGMLRHDMARLNGERSKQISLRDSIDGQIDFMQKKLAASQQFATNAVTMGASKTFSDLMSKQTDEINKQITTLQSHKYEQAREADRRKADNEVPITAYAIQVDDNGVPIPGQIRLLSLYKKELADEAARPMDTRAGRKLGPGWIWKDGVAGIKNEGAKPPQLRLFEKDMISAMEGHFGKQVKNGDSIEILMEPGGRERFHIATKIKDHHFQNFVQDKLDALDQMSYSRLGGFYASQANNKMDEYQYNYLKVYNQFGGDKDPRVAREKADEFVRQDKDYFMPFVQAYGFIPDPNLNPLVNKSAVGPFNPGETPTSSGIVNYR